MTDFEIGRHLHLLLEVNDEVEGEVLRERLRERSWARMWGKGKSYRIEQDVPRDERIMSARAKDSRNISLISPEYDSTYPLISRLPHLASRKAIRPRRSPTSN